MKFCETTNSAAVLRFTIVASWLDYCNSLLAGSSAANISHLQRIQNYLTRIIYGLPRNAHITPSLVCSHWLPIKQRIDFKLALLTWKALNFNQSSYLFRLLSPRNAVQMRSHCDHSMLDIHHICSRIEEQAFCFAAPYEWNALLSSVTSATSLLMFKARRVLRLTYLDRHFQQLEYLSILTD